MVMTEEKFKTIVKAMKAVYPQQTFIPDQDAFKVWYALLGDLDYKDVSYAVQKYMLTEKFPPTIADIRQLAVGDVIGDEMGELEAWARVRKAVENSGRCAEEEFKKLPLECQIAVGSPANLREWAMMNKDDFETVEQSHFVRNYMTAAKRVSDEQSMPEAVKKLLKEAREEHKQINAGASNKITTKE